MMISVDVSKATKDIHFPIVRAIPDRSVGLWSRVNGFFTYRRKWEVMKDYIIWCEFLKKYIFIPKHFMFDGASVPKILNSLYTPTGSLLLGACPHDLGYRYEGLIIVDIETGQLRFQLYSKTKLDAISKCLSSRESGLGVSASVATSVLGLFGRFSWMEHRHNHSDLEYDFPELFTF